MEGCFAVGDVTTVDDGGDRFGGAFAGDGFFLRGDLVWFWEAGEGRDESAEGHMVTLGHDEMGWTVRIF